MSLRGPSTVLVLALLAAPSAAAEWTPRAYAGANTLELRTIAPGEPAHWFSVWLVVIDDQVYVRLGPRAAGRIEKNVAAPYVGVPSGCARVTEYVPGTVGTHTAHSERRSKPVNTRERAPTGSPSRAVRSLGRVYKRLAPTDAPASPNSLPGFRSSARAGPQARNTIRSRVIKALCIVLPPCPSVRVRNVTAPPCDDKNRNHYSSGRSTRSRAAAVQAEVRKEARDHPGAALARRGHRGRGGGDGACPNLNTRPPAPPRSPA